MSINRRKVIVLISFLFSIIPSLTVGMLDALIKGRVVAIKYQNVWENVPIFWRDATLISYSKVVIFPIFLLASYGVVKLSGRWLLMIESLILGAFGWESFFYWCSMSLFKIPYIQLFGGEWRVVKPFEFPDKAPWLSKLLPLRLLAKIMGKNEITRKVVYVGLGVALIINLCVEFLKFFI